jgi:hypothetical protein
VRLDDRHRRVPQRADVEGVQPSPPGIETTFYGAWKVQVIDPFGNQIRFNDGMKQAGRRQT